MTDEEKQKISIQIRDLIENESKEVADYIEQFYSLFGTSTPVEILTSMIAAAAIQVISQIQYDRFKTDPTPLQFGRVIVEAMFFGCYASVRGEVDLTPLRNKQQ